MGTQILLFLLDTIFGLFIYAFLMRFFMQAFRVSFRNPFAHFVVALTDFAVKPARRIIPGVKGYDWATLLLAWITQALLITLSAVLVGPGTLRFPGMLVLLSLVELLAKAGWLFLVLVFAQAILSWVAPYSPANEVLRPMTTLLLRPLRRHLPLVVGGVDLSPLVFILVLQIGLLFLVPWLRETVMHLGM
jgi:YggT family protein